MKLSILLVFLSATLCAQQADVTINKEINRVAFGSCSVQSLPGKQLWGEINATNPDLWIWLGDNIYADTEDMRIMREGYELQKSHPDYQMLLTKTDVVGIWDDHDYGANDAGKEYPMKNESKDELFRFLDIDESHPARRRNGAYQSYTYKNEKSIKFILLDVRYFRDSLSWNNPGTYEKEALINSEGDILGEEQWGWLTEQLSEKEIDLFILCTGIQAIAEEHRWEKWSNFPKAKKRLVDLISEKVDDPLVILSGDRHLSEISKTKVEGYSFPLWDITSSSLTSPTEVKEEKNKYRVGEKIHAPNFASMKISWITGKPILYLNYIGAKGKVLAKHKIEFN